MPESSLNSTPIRGTHGAMVEARSIEEGTRRPASHPSARDGDPIDSSALDRQLTADLLETTAAKKLTGS